MKKRIIMSLALLTIIILSTGCSIFGKKEYIVTFNSNGGSNVPSQAVKEGSLVTKPNSPIKEGYTFVEWLLNGKTYDFSKEVKSNLTLDASYEQNISPEAKTYEVTFNTEGGSFIESQTIEEGKTISVPSEPTKEGYNFLYWTFNDSKYDFDTLVTKDIELTAKWEKIEENKVTYTVTFNTDGGSRINTRIIEDGKTVTKPSNPTKEGYTFVEWQFDGKTYNFNAKVTENIILKAVWKEIKKYSVTFNTNSDISVPSQIVTEGSKAIKPNNPSKDGYTFDKWMLNGKEYDFNTSVNSNITLVANWKEIKNYTVSFNTNGAETIPNQIVKEGNKVIKPTDPVKMGSAFVEWQFNGKAYDFDSVVTKDMVLKAVWSINKYTVTFNSNGGSPIVSQTVESGNKVAKPTNPTKEGYTFVEWQLDGKSYNFDNEVSANITLKAIWNNNLWDIDSTGAVIKYKGTGTSVIMPNEIDGITPLSIKSGAFDIKGLSNITLSDSITSIESEAIVKNTSNILNVYITAFQFDNNSWLKAIKGYSSMSIHRSQLGTFMYATLPGSSWTSAIYNKAGGYKLSYGGDCALPVLDTWYIKTEDYNLPNINTVGYTFKGWTDENGGLPKKDFTITKGNTKDKVLFAHCDVNKWSFKLVYDEGNLDYSKVDYHKNPYCGSSTYYCKYNYYDTVEIPYNQVIREGYTFIGWATTKTGTVKYKEGQKVSKVVNENNGN